MHAEETEGVCAPGQGWGGGVGRVVFSLSTARMLGAGSTKLGPSTEGRTASQGPHNGQAQLKPGAGWLPNTETGQDHTGNPSLERSPKVTRSTSSFTEGKGSASRLSHLLKLSCTELEQSQDQNPEL